MVAENDASGNSQKGTSNTQLEEPNYTQVPNLLFEHMAEMTEAELRCMLAIVRKIIGYHKDGPEALSYSQLEKLTGMSRQGVIQGIEKAIMRGWLKVAGQGKRGVKLYTLNFGDQSTKLTSEGKKKRTQKPVNKVDQSTSLTSTSQLSGLDLVNEVDTQKKVLKETFKEVAVVDTVDSEGKPTEVPDEPDRKEITAAATTATIVQEKTSDPQLEQVISAPERPNIFVLYEQNLGIITPMMAEELKAAETEYPAGWIEDAIREAVANNVHRWSYAKKILCRWKVEGRSKKGLAEMTQPLQPFTPDPNCTLCGGSGIVVPDVPLTSQYYDHQMPCPKCAQQKRGNNGLARAS